MANLFKGAKEKGATASPSPQKTEVEIVVEKYRVEKV